MDFETAEKLCEVTNEFYRLHSDSFSDTRRGLWPGWNKCLATLEDAGILDDARRAGKFSVLDLACGNMRFEAYLFSVLRSRGLLGASELEFFAVDNCDGLAKGACVFADAADSDGTPFAGGGSAFGELPDDRAFPLLSYQNLDVLGALREGGRLCDLLEATPCDLSVAFGFMHHVPLPAWREEILRALIGCTRSGGYVAVSFWRFLHDAAFAAKAQVEHERAISELGLPPLDAGDCVLGWKNEPGAFRYCHHFDDAELDRLVSSVSDAAQEVARFCADGRTGEMNAYVMLQVK